MTVAANLVSRIAALRKITKINTQNSHIVAFVFLGEFGYELLNWQGLVRTYSINNPSKTIVALSRTSCGMLYTDHSKFISLDSNERYLKSVASGYFARSSIGRTNGIRDCLGAYLLRRSIITQIRQEMNTKNATVVFSDRCQLVDGIQFGASRFRFGLEQGHASIYDGKALKHNKYVQLSTKQKLAIESDYIFVMTARRSRIVRDNTILDVDSILNALSSIGNVVVGEFKTLRKDETEPIYNSNSKIHRRSISNLEEQVNLIEHSKVCVFISEGDFRSHTYVPPMAGRDVFVVGSSGIFKNGDIEGWNRHVFEFGGQIIPLPVELVDPNTSPGCERLRNLISNEMKIATILI
jgi:hypothetical protein